MRPAPAAFVAPTSAARQEALNERERAAHLLSRFAFGQSPAELERVLAKGVEACPRMLP